MNGDTFHFSFRGAWQGWANIQVPPTCPRYITFPKATHLETDLLKNNHTKGPATTFLSIFFPIIFWANSSLSVYLSYPHPLKMSLPFCFPG